MGKYNKQDDPDGLSEVELKTFKGKAKKVYFWMRRNPLKVIIIVLSIIIFSLIIAIPVKDTQIRNFPARLDEA